MKPALTIPHMTATAVRFWLMLRAEQPEVGYVDGASYDYANVADYAPGDNIRRTLVNKTIVLRNYLGYSGLP